MERSLLWSCLLAGGARPAAENSPREKSPSSLLLLAFALPIAVFFITLPEAPPFGAGQGFGRGFVLGSVGALLAMVVIRRAASTPSAMLPSLLSSQFIAPVVVALALLFLRATIIDTLLGIACGWLAVTIVLLQGTSTPAIIASSASGVGFAVALCAVSALGVYRDFLTPEITRGTWSSVAVTFAAGVPISVLLSGQIRERLLGHLANWRASVISAFCAAAILILLANLLALKILAQPRFSLVAAIGLLAGFLMWWAARVEGTNASEEVRSTSQVPSGAFVMLAAVVLSFGLLQGFGVGLMLLAAWPAVGLSLQRSATLSTPETLTTVAIRLLQCLLFGVVLLLERLFEQRFKTDLRGVAITDYYALLGFLIGAALPSLLSGWLQDARHKVNTAWLRLVFVGAAALALPAALMLLWGVKTSFALLFGLSLACLLARDVVKTISLNASLLAVAIALLVTQWTHRLLPLAEMTRGERLRALGIVIFSLLLFIVISDLYARLVKRKNERTEVLVS
jgi:hypothetical protein